MAKVIARARAKLSPYPSAPGSDVRSHADFWDPTCPATANPDQVALLHRSRPSSRPVGRAWKMNRPDSSRASRSGPSDSGIQKLVRCYGLLHDAHPACGLQIVNLSEERELGRCLRADRIFDDLAIYRWHRNSDRHLIQCKLQRACFSECCQLVIARQATLCGLFQVIARAGSIVAAHR